MFDIITKIFGKEIEDEKNFGSSQIAKERLQNLLVNDRASMDKIFMDTISKYTVKKDEQIFEMV